MWEHKSAIPKIPKPMYTYRTVCMTRNFMTAISSVPKSPEGRIGTFVTPYTQRLVVRLMTAEKAENTVDGNLYAEWS